MHVFGGKWTDDKLELLQKYLEAFVQIFTRNRRASFYKTWYVDAFAGTGHLKHIADDTTQGNLFEEFLTETQEFKKGSASIALEVEPGFDNYLFIDENPQRCQELEALKQKYPIKKNRIHVECGEANQILTQWISQQDWDRTRAVVFLDPYGMQVEWPLIELIAKTEAIDLWLLFPLGIGVNRLLTRDEPPNVKWADRLTKILGTEDWKTAFYKQHQVQTLFGPEERVQKEADFESIGKFFLGRLKTIFADVATNPFVMRNRVNNPLYLFCFAVGNPKGAKAALNIANSIIGRKLRGY